MQAVNKLYIKVVPQPAGDFMLLCGFDSQVTHRTAAQYASLCAPSRRQLDEAIAAMKKKQNALTIEDVTVPAIQKKLAKLFGEDGVTTYRSVVESCVQETAAPIGGITPSQLAALSDVEFFKLLKETAETA